MCEHGKLIGFLSEYFDENAAVKALGYILNRYPSCREALTDLFHSGGANVERVVSARSHLKKSVPSKGIRAIPLLEDFEDKSTLGPSEGRMDMPGSTVPDLVLCSYLDVETVLVEVKFDAALTPNQPNGYLNRLPWKRESIVLFVAPGARLQDLWRQLLKSVHDGGGNLVIKSDVNLTGHINSAKLLDSDKFLMLVDWKTLLDAMASFAKRDGNSAAECDIRQLGIMANIKSSHSRSVLWE